jgi:hypothetical protein
MMKVELTWRQRLSGIPESRDMRKCEQYSWSCQSQDDRRCPVVHTYCSVTCWPEEGNKGILFKNVSKCYKEDGGNQ